MRSSVSRLGFFDQFNHSESVGRVHNGKKGVELVVVRKPTYFLPSLPVVVMKGGIHAYLFISSWAEPFQMTRNFYHCVSSLL